jgi:hypothetical protein
MATRFEESSYLRHLVSAKSEITARGTSDDKVPPAPTDGVLIDFDLADRSHRTTDARRPLRRPARDYWTIVSYAERTEDRRYGPDGPRLFAAPDARGTHRRDD